MHADCELVWVNEVLMIDERGNEFSKINEKLQMTVMEIKYLFMDFMH